MKRPRSYLMAGTGMVALGAIIGLLAVTFAPSPDAHAVTPPDSCFAFNSGTGTITDYYNNEGNNGANPACSRSVDIPSTIGGVAVTGIGNNAFWYSRLTSVTIPSGVTSIGNNAFQGNQLTSVIIPSGVTSIGNNAFYGNRLTSLTIPSSVTSIGVYAFAWNQLTSPVILGTPTGINVFISNPIESISYNGTIYTPPNDSPSSPPVPADACFAFASGTGTITRYELYSLTTLKAGTACLSKNVTIPSTIGGVAVTSIGNNAFQYNQLASVTIPSGVTSIGNSAFSSNQLTSLTIPSGVTSIGNSAFSSNQLTSLTIPSSMTSIGSTAFAWNRLTSLTIPSSVTSIGSDAFKYNQLTSPVILGTPTGTNVFSNNPLVSISYNGTVYTYPYAPSSPVMPPEACFSFDSGSGQITNYEVLGLTDLRNGTVCLDRNIIVPSSIGGVPVTGVLGYGIFGGKNLTGITFPDSVTSEIDVSYNNLTALQLPNGIVEMTSYNYVYNSLTRLTIPASVTAIDPDALFGQNLWGTDVMNQGPKYIYSDDPAIAQYVYDNIWYVRAYTADPSNPVGLLDSAVAEEWDIGYDVNQNGTTSDSIGGHIINPASTVVKYVDSKGASLSPDVTVTGIKTGKSVSSALESSDYLHSYHVTESAIPAPLDPYGPTAGEQTAMETGFSQYYRMGQSVEFRPKAISGYITPSAQTVVLNDEDNVVTFVYSSAITSTQFSTGTVVGGEKTGTSPPSSLVPTLSNSTLMLSSNGDGSDSDCSTIQSASLLAPETIAKEGVPSGTTLLGGLEFSLVCSTGGKTGIEYALGSVVQSTSKLRVYKYTTSTKELTDITSQVSFSTKLVGGVNKTVISYNLTDGGSLDEDGTANGTIEDPIVIGYTGDVSELARTGGDMWMVMAGAVSLMVVSAGLFYKQRKLHTTRG